MSDWYRGGRDMERGRYGPESPHRRDFGRDDRWRDEGRRAAEPRSFDERHPAPERGGYTGESFGGPDFTPQRPGGWDFRRDRPAGRQESLDDRYARGMRGEPERRSWSDQPYERRHDERERHGRGGGAMPHNPVLERLAEGEADHPWREHRMGGGRDMDEGREIGRHRGRGPKNYVRSDERIREDVNDRLCDDPWLDASEIEVQVAKGEVTLSGTVQSRDDKRRAEDLAERVSGAKHVQNNLRVQPHPTQDPRDIPANAGGQAPPVT